MGGVDAASCGWYREPACECDMCCALWSVLVQPGPLVVLTRRQPAAHTSHMVCRLLAESTCFGEWVQVSFLSTSGLSQPSDSALYCHCCCCMLQMVVQEPSHMSISVQHTEQQLVPATQALADLAAGSSSRHG